MQNSVFLVGKLTKYETEKFGESRVARLTIACANGKNSDGPAYYNIDMWNPTSEQSKHLKGIVGEGRVAVTGFLKVDKWEDKKTGSKRTAVKVVALDVFVAFERPRRDNDENGGKSGTRKPFKKNRREDSEDEETEAPKKRRPRDEDEEDETPRKRKQEDDDTDDTEDDDEEAPF